MIKYCCYTFQFFVLRKEIMNHFTKVFMLFDRQHGSFLEELKTCETRLNSNESQSTEAERSTKTYFGETYHLLILFDILTETKSEISDVPHCNSIICYIYIYISFHSKLFEISLELLFTILQIGKINASNWI